MSARLSTALLGVCLLAAGCNTAQPTAFLIPPIPKHEPYVPLAQSPTSPTPQALTPAPRTPSFSGTLATYSRDGWSPVRPIYERMVPMGRPTSITVHHAGDIADLSSRPKVKVYLAGVQGTHMKPKSQGGMEAGDIGYHYLIDPDGSVWEGRSMRHQGAHAGNNDANRGNIGVCLMGDFNQQKPTAAQKESLRRLLTRLMGQYDIPASRIYTHREVKARFGLSPTDCPGSNLQPYVNALRQNSRTALR